MDNYPGTAHPNVSLKNIKLEFFPPNTTSLIQLLVMEIVQNLKLKCKVTLINYILEKIKDNLLQSQSMAIDISKQINIIQANKIILDSWYNIGKPSHNKTLFL